MYLKEYIEKLKRGNFLDEKSWLDQNAILEILSENVPDSKTEEWKNFRTNPIKENSWKIFLEKPAKEDYLKKNYSKFCLITILFICVFQSQSVFASREPRIRVLISKNNNLRIRSDRSIPLIIEGEFFSSKKIKGLTVKNEKNRKILYFDKNKQKKYDLKSNQQLQIRSFDGRGIWVGQKLSLIHI